MPGCNDCKHHKSELGDFVDGKFELIHKCLLGNDTQMRDWWVNNGKKKRSIDVFDEMECHDYHESTKSLMKMTELVDKLSNHLEKNKNI